MIVGKPRTWMHPLLTQMLVAMNVRRKAQLHCLMYNNSSVAGTSPPGKGLIDVQGRRTMCTAPDDGSTEYKQLQALF